MVEVPTKMDQLLQLQLLRRESVITTLPLGMCPSTSAALNFSSLRWEALAALEGKRANLSTSSRRIWSEGGAGSTNSGHSAISQWCWGFHIVRDIYSSSVVWYTCSIPTIRNTAATYYEYVSGAGCAIYYSYHYYCFNDLITTTEST